MESKVLTVDDLEEVQLELNKFQEGPIPALLEGYLKLVATAGSTFFPWTKVKALFRVKLEQVITEFFEASPLDDIPPMPNVDSFNFNSVKDKVFDQLDAFAGIPFTVQRLAELLTSPKRHYKRTDKFMRALEKNMLVVSSVEPKSQASPPPPPPPLTNGDHSSNQPISSSDEKVSCESKEVEVESKPEEGDLATPTLSNEEVPISSSSESSEESSGKVEETEKTVVSEDPCDSAKAEPEEPVKVEEDEANGEVEKSVLKEEEGEGGGGAGEEVEASVGDGKVEEMEVDAECSSTDAKIQQIGSQEGNDEKPQQ